MASSERHLLAPSPVPTPSTPPTAHPPMEAKFGCFSFRSSGHHAPPIPSQANRDESSQSGATPVAELPLFDVSMDGESPATPRFFNTSRSIGASAAAEPNSGNETRQARFDVPNEIGETDATAARSQAKGFHHNREPSRQEGFSGVLTRKASFKEEEGNTRVVHINDPDKTSLRGKKSVSGNGVRTSKYSFLSFLPKNLFEQFQRVAYIYFLIIVILNQIPPLAVFGRTASVFPLAFVLAATALKDAFEDYGRHRSDRAENNRTSLVLEGGFYQSKKWKHIRVGQMIRIPANEIVPADIVLLGTSDPNGLAYVETMNLDGESNLKTRYAKQETASLNPEEGSIRGTLICEMPNRNIYEFNGYLDMDGVHIPLGPNNILLRGCEVKNTSWAIGVVVYAGKQTKAMLNNSGAQSKRSRLEREMNKATGYLVIFLLALCLVGGLGMGLWLHAHRKYLDDLPYYRKRTYEEYDDKKKKYEDYNYYGIVGEGVIAFLSCIIVFQIMVPIALYISLELVRLWQAHFMTLDMQMYHDESKSRFQCRALNINEDLGQVKYIFSDKTGTLTENKMEFHSASVAGIEYGSADASDGLEGTISSEDNSVVFGNQAKAKSKVDTKLLTLLQSSANTAESRAAHEYMLVLAACNTIVPTKVQMGSNGLLEMTAAANGETANGEDGHIEYQGESPDEIALVKAAASYGYVLLERSLDTVLIDVMGKPQRFQLLGLHEFDSIRKRMSVIIRCPDGTLKVLVKGADNAMLDVVARRGGDEEINMVEEKHRNGVILATMTHIDKFSATGLRTLVIGSKEINQEQYDNWRHKYDKASTALNGRASLLRETSALVENDLALLGATAIEDRLQEGVPETIALLREAGIKVWVLTGDKQETAISIGFSCQLLTPDMQQIIIHESTKEGALQSLKTAKTIYEISADDINGDIDKDGITSDANANGSLPTSAYFPSNGNTSGSQFPSKTTHQQLALIIDGNSLVHALQPDVEDELYHVARACKVVICCRVAPMQKAAVVNLIKQKTGEMTLAIGDGANDVSMIQMADIGIGLSGQEGRQAVVASDFAMGQFRFLKRLLLVHGHWNYQRLSYMILYNFYRNAVFVFVLFWLILYTAYSPVEAVTDWSSVFFSLIYSSIPTIVVAALDKDLSHKTLNKYPALYGVGQRGEGYNQLLFWVTMADTIWQSLVLFYVPFFTYWGSDADLFGLGNIWTLGVVLLVNLHLAMDVYRWNWLSHLSIWGSILATFIVMLVLDSLQLDVNDNYGSFRHILGDAKFYIDILIILPVALLPRFCVKVMRQRFWPSDIQIAREEEIKGGYDSDSRNNRYPSTLELSSIPPA